MITAGIAATRPKSVASSASTMRALANQSPGLTMPHGDNSRNSAVADFSSLLSRSAGAAVGSEVGDTVGIVATDGAGAVVWAGTAGCAATAEGPCGTGRCWAA